MVAGDASGQRWRTRETRWVSMPVASSSYLASAASTTGLVGAILVPEEWSDGYKEEMLEVSKVSHYPRY